MLAATVVITAKKSPSNPQPAATSPWPQPYSAATARCRPLPPGALRGRRVTCGKWEPRLKVTSSVSQNERAAGHNPRVSVAPHNLGELTCGKGRRRAYRRGDADRVASVWPGAWGRASPPPPPRPDGALLADRQRARWGSVAIVTAIWAMRRSQRERERERCASPAQTPTGPWKERRTCETQVCRALCHADGSSWEPQETRAGAAADSCTLALGGRAGLGLRVPVRQSLATANGRRVSPGQMSAVDTPETERTSMHRLISSGEKKKTKCGCVRVAFRRKKTESRIDEQEEVAASD